VPTWIWAAAGTVVLIAVGVLGFFIIVNVNPAQLHPSADAVPVTGAAPAERWTAAADDGRKLARAAVAEQNVPGLSVAVGVGREVVWAEGFGYAYLVTRTPVDPGMRFRIGHVSNTSMPLNTSTVAPAIQSDAVWFWKNMLSSDVAISTQRPIVKKLPHALKSRRLTKA